MAQWVLSGISPGHEGVSIRGQSACCIGFKQLLSNGERVLEGLRDENRQILTGWGIQIDSESTYSFHDRTGTRKSGGERERRRGKEDKK